MKNPLDEEIYDGLGLVLGTYGIPNHRIQSTLVIPGNHQSNFCTCLLGYTIITNSCSIVT